MGVEESIEELHEKLDKVLDLFEKAIERFDKVLERSGDSSTGALAEKMNEVLEQNSQIADGVVALSEMVRDLRDAGPTNGSPKEEEHEEMFEDLKGPEINIPSMKPKKRLFKK
ncbi:hypothetical protein HZA97_01595 [Candidatus Woesearchaeota archaeon]|nr:hypothetical protein [Candidatus Woesearchaeota archaeon]